MDLGSKMSALDDMKTYFSAKTQSDDSLGAAEKIDFE